MAGSADPVEPGVLLVPGCRDVELDAERCVVRLPAGVSLDLGGDVRCRGEAPDPRGWVVAITATTC